jgi:hypothetical protein
MLIAISVVVSGSSVQRGDPESSERRGELKVANDLNSSKFHFRQLMNNGIGNLIVYQYSLLGYMNK